MIIKTERWRRPVQIVFFLLIAMITVNHTLAENGKGVPFLSSASLHAVCPFGGVVTVYKLIAEGQFVQKVHESSLVLGIAVFAAALLLGPAFCGWICPFGTFQEFVAKLGRKLLGRRYGRIIPKRLDRVLRYLRYLVLIMVVVMTAVSGKLLFSEVDPYFALFQFWTGEVAITAFIVLGVVLLLSLVVERPFCRYACPYGAFLGLTNKFRIMPIRRRASTCISCGKCDRSCPMGIDVSKKTVIRDSACISCLVCTSDGVCPVPATVDMRIAPWKEIENEN
jgi:polyferredoxin